MKPQTLMTLRRYHLFIGVFFAPAIILFAISGSLQTFRLNEEKGWGGTPPGWMVWVAAVHKDQALPRTRPAAKAPPAAKPVAKDDDHDEDKLVAASARPPSPLPLKIFVVMMALGLLISTLIGLTVAFANKRTRRTYALIFLAGAVLPLALLFV